MTPNLHLLAPAGEVLISAYVGSSGYVFDVPPTANSAGTGHMRAFKFSFDISKGSALDSGDYLKLQTSPDGGTTWVNLPAAYDDSDAANFLDGKSGTSASFEATVWLMPGQKVRLKANAGLTLTKVGISY